MKLNMGCGFAKLEGYTNVDSWAYCGPDVVCILDKEPWPWEDSTVDEVVFDHSLEHMGATTEEFFHVMGELYRVCKSGATVVVVVPHPRHDAFFHDPTHVRAIYPETLAMFNLQLNLQQIADGQKNSKLAMQTSTNFEIVDLRYHLEDRYQLLLDSGELVDTELMALLRSENNVAHEVRIVLKAVK